MLCRLFNQNLESLYAQDPIISILVKHGSFVQLLLRHPKERCIVIATRSFNVANVCYHLRASPLCHSKRIPLHNDNSPLGHGTLFVARPLARFIVSGEGQMEARVEGFGA
jgi:hypothetical protein